MAGRSFYRQLTLVTVLAVTACARPPSITSDLDLEMNPSGRTPLAGLIRFTTDQPTRATLTITDGEHTSTVTPNDAFVTDHELMVLGLRPGRLNTVEVAIENERGETGATASVDITTEPLPDYFPPIDVTLSRPARMEPGLTIIGFTRAIDQEFDEEFALALAIDAQGEVVWYYEVDHVLDEPRRLANGHLLYQSFRGSYLVEADMLGRTVNRWHTTRLPYEAPEGSIPVDADTFHHDILEMPSGNLLALSSEVRHFDSYPSSEEDVTAPWAPADVIGDVLIEFQRDGTIVRSFKLFDLLDPTRIGYRSLGTGFYETIYESVLDEPGYDWSHGNGIYYDATDDSAIISSNHQSVVMKLDMSTGQLVWMLGTPDGWGERWRPLLLAPKGDLQWPWHQHAPKLTPAGTLLVYDNGPYRALPPSPKVMPPEAYSRAVEYRIDEVDRTVEQVWSYGDPGEDWFFSGYISEAEWLPQTGNILITNGGRVRLEDGSPGVDGIEGHGWISIVEVTHTVRAEPVWEIVIDDPAVTWSVYRSDRWPSLYPPAQ